MTGPNTGNGGAPAYASMWSRVLVQELGHLLQLGLADGTTCIARLERVEHGRAVLTIDGRARVIDLDQLRVIEAVDSATCGERTGE